MPKFYKYIMSEEIAVNPNTLQVLVGNNQEYLYLHNNPNRMHYLPSEEIILESIDDKFVIYQNAVTGIEITDDFGVMNWFQIQQIKFPMLTWFAYIIHSIIPLQNEN